MSRVSSGCALPENTFNSPNPVAIVSSPITGQPQCVRLRASEGWLALNVDAHDKPLSAPTGPPGNYQSVGNADRETSYFLTMYLRDYRAIDPEQHFMVAVR